MQDSDQQLGLLAILMSGLAFEDKEVVRGLDREGTVRIEIDLVTGLLEAFRGDEVAHCIGNMNHVR